MALLSSGSAKGQQPNVAAAASSLTTNPPAGAPGASQAKRVRAGGNAKKNLPQVAVIGRPNVGKSTIANRLTKEFATGAVVFNEPGVTRDRLYGEGFWREHEFTVVDTGGIVFDDNPDEVFLREIRQQAMIALSEAAVVLLVVDGQSGNTVLDEQIAAFLRRQKTPVVLAVNKCASALSTPPLPTTALPPLPTPLTCPPAPGHVVTDASQQ